MTSPFRAGDELRAADLQSLAARVRALQQRVFGLNATPIRSIRAEQSFAAFALAIDRGALMVRRGVVYEGAGQYAVVGDAEWTPLGSLRPCTVWLICDPEQHEYSVEVTEGADVSSPSTALRLRLAYVRQVTDLSDEGEGGAVSWHCVQVRRGLLYPFAPRRLRGVARGDTPETVAEAVVQCADAGWMTAGERYTEGATVWGGGTVHFLSALSYTARRLRYWMGAPQGGYKLLESIAISNSS